VKASSEQLSQLCIACGLCCDGTLFKDVELQPGDNPERLRELSIPLMKSKFPQPCFALCSNLACRIYEDRPNRCRQFECALFLEVRDDKIPAETALKTIAQTRKRAEKVRRLLRQLGDNDETTALSLRFKRIKRSMELGEHDDDAIEIFSELTLAVHDLTRNLAAHFYP
jgi:Fe-S-cluster containining protein